MNNEQMRERVAEARVARLATVTSDGWPHLVPCCFALAGDVVYSAVDAKPKSTHRLRRLANVRANPKAALLVDFYADDWSTLWWVRVDGAARIITAGADLDAAIVLLRGKYEQYVSAPPPGPVIAIEIVTWRTWP